MTDLIDVVQKQDPGSELVELYEIQLTDGTILYFHGGLDDNLTTIQFRDKASPYTARTYAAFPIIMDGVDISADGAQNRPSLTVANVTNVLSDQIGNVRNEDLIGSRLTKRITLKRYLVGESHDSSPPIEFPSRKYILDRLSAETNLSVTFELAAPFDLSGVKLPNRTVIGKYCAWGYQGYSKSQKGGCYWSKDSIVTYADGSEGALSHKAYFTVDDDPIVPAADSSAMTTAGWTTFETYTTYSASTSYSAGDYVEYNNGTQTTIWKCLLANTGQTPGQSPAYWTRGDVCGKKLSSCKCRFQFKPETPASANSIPSTEQNTNKNLPFGAFIGSRKFR